MATAATLRTTPIKEPEIDWTYVARIEPGEYPAYSRLGQIYYDRQFKRWSFALQFDVLDVSLTRVIAPLTWYMNLGKTPKPRANRRSNYWKAWLKANGGPPSRNDRLSKSIFERRYARILVGDTQKTFNSNTVEPGYAYSVVKDVVRWETDRIATKSRINKSLQSSIKEGSREMIDLREG